MYTAIDEYCTFELGQKTFAVRTEKFDQIAGRPGSYPLSPLPGAPKHIKGKINLKGHLKGHSEVPVVDLRMRVGLRPTVFTERTCMLIVHVGRQLAALLVDRLIDIREISSTEVESATKAKSPCVVGRTCLDGVILLDIDKILSARTLAKIGKLCNRV